ncbi:MAG: hypothetical protein ABL921_13515 [Pirellula sp.]
MSNVINTNSSSGAVGQIPLTSAPIDSEAGIAIVPETVEYRSEMIAKSAVRINEIPPAVVQFLSCVKSNFNGNEDELSGLLTELIHSARMNDSSKSLDRNRVSDSAAGIAISLRWIVQSQSQIGEPTCMKLVLKSLMPMYLAAGQGRAGTSLADTLGLFRWTCTLIELDRLTNNHDLAEWIRTNSSAIDPIELVRSAFRVNVPKMSQVFWSQVSAKSATIRGNSSPSMSLNASNEKQGEAWWSLANQFYEHRTQITVPANLGIGLIDWNKLLDHWQRLSCVLDGTPQPANPAIDLQHNAKSKDNVAEPQTETKKTNLDDRRFIEIRSAKDPQLSASLDALLRDARNEQGLLSLIVVKKLGGNSGQAESMGLQNWQSDFIHWIDSNAEAANVRGFISDDGELTLVYQDVERSELASWIRDSFTKMGTTRADSSLATTTTPALVAGIASVNAPSRSFTIEQLIQSAWRCLEGASTQGAGAVKTIEVY